MRAILLTALALVLAGCGAQDGRQLPVTALHTWSMPPQGALIPAPRCVWAGADHEVLALDTSGRVLRFDGDGTLLSTWFMPATSVGRPEGICRLLDGRIAVADTHYHRIVYFDNEGRVLGMHGRKGTEPGQFIYPVGITQAPDGSIFVAEYGSNDRVQKFDAKGRFILAFGAFGTGRQDFQRPSGLAWHDGEVFVADAINNRIQVFDEDGGFRRTLGNTAEVSLEFPYDVSIGPDGRLWTVEYAAGRVTCLETDGTLVGRYGRTGRGHGEFSTPWSITIDTRGRLRVADTGNRRIVAVRL